MAGLGNTYGAALVGTCISAVLYGVTILQVFMCFREYPQDKFWDKLGVCLLLILDSLHTTFCIYAMYWYLVINFGVFPELAMMHWSFEAQQMLNVLVISGVHT
ncbi:uncharacterized protein C8Q71DRAFT_858796 [Rhodofomes roseus]|uniref:Uncharacterized protein n=1 Tax=Rhodofomes roseus TaxID=34475 RepID=A0ABQ8KDE5_9APHY|nr:uncharacterized protein C8Q71DRAFT_858796 [Rhodofomes roseus]KAH9835129.1 hypothetical protein C8Q71DRAFT_858796 [Rhodofomes roseus]